MDDLKLKYPFRIAISVKDLSIGYDNSVVLENICCEIGDGEIVSLIGRNGTGKSTFLRTVAGVQRPLSGHININGRDLCDMREIDRSKIISFVSTSGINIPNLSVFDMVGMGRSPYTNWVGTLSPDDRRKVNEALDAVGMQKMASKNIDALSDGERQRVVIARALAQDTPIILLDEPTAFLDLPNKYEICMLLKTLAHENCKTILFSTHDLNMAIDLCDRIIIILEGELVSGRSRDIIEGGMIDRFFEGTSLQFDRETDKVILHK